MMPRPLLDLGLHTLSQAAKDLTLPEPTYIVDASCQEAESFANLSPCQLFVLCMSCVCMYMCH